MRTLECEGCGLTAYDLPDDVNPELIFEREDDGPMLCQGCQQIPAGQRLAEWSR